MKISKDPTGNRARNLPSCGAVPKPNEAPLAPFHFQKIHKVCHTCAREKCTVQQATSRISSNRNISLCFTKVFIQLRYALLILHTAHCNIQGIQLKTEPAHMVSINVYIVRGAFLLNRGTTRRRADDIIAACRPTTPPAL